MLELKFKAE